MVSELRTLSTAPVMRRLILHLNDSVRHGSKEPLSLLRLSDRLSLRERAQLQEDRLRSMLLHSVRFVSYYRRVATEREISLSLIEAAPREALLKFPLLTRDLLRDQFDQLRSEASNKGTYLNQSGGSTGQPARFLQDHVYASTRQAIKIYFDERTSYRPGDPKVVLWGSPRDLAGVGRFRTRLARYLRNEIWLDALALSHATVAQYANAINRFQPRQVLGYAESLFEFARLATSNNISLHSPTAVLSTAGTLTPEMRIAIERAFSCRVYNRYGAREVGDVACECSAGTMHVSELTHLVEIVDPDGRRLDDGERGSIAITLLTNKSMPLIRYRIGDVGAVAVADCTCGIRGLAFKQVDGRESEFFVAPSGRRVNGRIFSMALWGQTWIDRFQVVQESEKLIRVSIKPADDSRIPADSGRTLLSKLVHDNFGGGCELSIQLVDNLAPSPSGKFRFIYTNLTPNQHDHA